MVVTRTLTVSYLLVFLSVLVQQDAHGVEKLPRYFFKITNVEAQDPSTIPIAKELLEAEVASRPEFAENIGKAASDKERMVDFERRGMKGYELSMRVVSLSTKINPPAPGARDSQMAIAVKLSIFGYTLPGGVLKFTGDGEAQLEGEFSERRRAKEEEKFIRTALTSALKQAVDTAIMKMKYTTLSTKGFSKGKKVKPQKK
jgi:hypothetical protein